MGSTIVPQLVDRIAERSPDAPALVSLDPEAPGGVRTMSYRELTDASRRVAAELADRGVQAGEGLAIWMSNRAPWLVIALATMRLGGFVVPINTRFRFADAANVMRATGVQRVAVAERILDRNLPEELAVALRTGEMQPLQTTIIVGADDPAGISTRSLPGSNELAAYEDLVHGTAPMPAPRQIAGDQPAHLYVSSGTTGSPKLVVHTHDSIGSRFTTAGAYFGLEPGEVMLGALPLAGAWGYGAAFCALTRGATLALVEVFDPASVIEVIETCGVTHVHASDDMLRAIIRHPTFTPQRAASWHSTHYGNFTGLAGVDLVHEGAAAGVNFSAAYGASEFHAFVTAWRGDEEPDQRCQAGGWIINDDVEVRCVDLDSGEVLDHHQRGEIQVRGTSVFSGYLGNAELTAEVFTPDGWYRSGDLGETLPDRGVIFHSRARDTLRLRGFLVDPREIEQELMTHPDVDLAQVVGIQDAEVGQVAVAFVRPREGASIDPEQLRRHVRDRVASYKVPAMIRVLDTFPVIEGPNGVKIQKDRLREMAREAWTSQPG